jgi:hypothetical protein
MKGVFHTDVAMPVKIIFDTDMSGDCDDVGALAILHKLTDQGKAELMACVVNGHDQDKAVAATVSVINTYYGRSDVPIGTYQGAGYGATQSKYTAKLRDEFCHIAKPDDQEPKAVDIYRRALVDAPDESVVIVSVGFLINLRELLESTSDAISSLYGIDLVKQKVKKLVVMGGAFPQGGPECNFSSGGGAPDTRYVAEHWPTPILFTGFEIGQGIITGKGLATAPATNPVRRAYELFTSFHGRESWDLTAALAAVEDPTLYWKVSDDGYCEVFPDGKNQWHSTPHRGHAYLIENVSPVEIAQVLDDLLALPPGKL